MVGKRNLIITFLVLIILSGCSNQIGTEAIQNTVQKEDLQAEDVRKVTVTDKPEPTVANSKEDTYCFDASLSWDAGEYKAECGQDLNYFSAAIDSPYQYTYQCEKENMTIEEIAYELGVILMDDLMREYDGKAFTITEYRKLEPHVMSEDEVTKWETSYKLAWKSKPVVILDNQWLCSFGCEYKYTGVYAGIGEMPQKMEWMETLYRDGSGEKFAFIIQKQEDEEYIMRGLPKTVIVEK